MKYRIDYPIDNIGPIYFEFESKEKKLKENLKMFGSIRYRDLSVYTGPLIYKNGKGNKIGFGTQDMTKAPFSTDETGLDENIYKYDRYVGLFDYRKTDWIYGNGVMYFTDHNGKPKAFVKAFFSSLKILKPYVGEFDYSNLLANYTKDMEISPEMCVPHRARLELLENRCHQAKNINLLMIGDSWFHFYDEGPEEALTGEFKKDSANKSVINIGIGGTTFADWIKYLPNFNRAIKYNSILINLGINDIHSNLTVKHVYSNFLKLIKIIRNNNKDCKIYVNEVARAPGFINYSDNVKNLNKMIKAYCGSNNLSFVECCQCFYKENGELLDNISSYYGEDLLHLNKKGSAVWKEKFIGLFENE